METKLLISRSQSNKRICEIYVLDEDVTNIEEIRKKGYAAILDESKENYEIEERKDEVFSVVQFGSFNQFSYKFDFIYDGDQLIVVKLKHGRKLHKLYMKIKNFKIESVEKVVRNEPSYFYSEDEINKLFKISDCASVCIDREFLVPYTTIKFDFNVRVNYVAFEYNLIPNSDIEYVPLSDGNIKIYQDRTYTAYVKIVVIEDEKMHVNEFTKIVDFDGEFDTYVNGSLCDGTVDLSSHVKVKAIHEEDIMLDDRMVRLTGKRKIKLLNVISDKNKHRRVVDSVYLKITNATNNKTITKQLKVPIKSEVNIDKIVIYKKRILDKTAPIFPIKKDKFLEHIILREGGMFSNDYIEGKTNIISNESEDYFIDIQDSAIIYNTYLYTIYIYDDNGRESEPIILVK